jgi:hypothetical protein
MDGHCLQVSNGKGSAVTTGTCTGKANQVFTVKKNDKGNAYVVIQLVNDLPLCVEGLPPPSPTPAAPTSPKESKNPAPLGSYPFYNYSLPLEERLTDLVQRLNVTEMLGQLTESRTAPIKRLGIGVYSFYGACLSGFDDGGVIGAQGNVSI